MSVQGRLWTTKNAEPGQAFRYWTNVVCHELIELEIATLDRNNFEAWMLKCALGCVHLNFIHARQQEVLRTRAAISRSAEARYDLIHVRNGSVLLRHYGRTCSVAAGEGILLDCSEVYQFATSDVCECISLQIPQKWLRAWVATPEDGVAHVLRSSHPWSAALLAALSALTPESVGTLSLSGGLVADQIGALVALAIGSREHERSRRQRMLLPRVRQTMCDQAHDENLRPGTVAAAHGVSRRYLHGLFAAVGTTFCRELVKIRLERARQMLTNPAFKQLSVSEIAWRCGFNDPSHFARRFGQAYGVAPSASRHLSPSALALPETN